MRDRSRACQSDGVQQRWWRADDEVSRNLVWVAVDVSVALLSAGIAVGDSDSTASVESGPIAVRLAVVLWFLSISLRRFLPVTCLWGAGAATAVVAAAGQPLTNLSLATALALGLVFAPARSGLLPCWPPSRPPGRWPPCLPAPRDAVPGHWLPPSTSQQRCGALPLAGRPAVGLSWSGSVEKAPWRPSGHGWRWTCTTRSVTR
jgi:hypothetical protein